MNNKDGFFQLVEIKILENGAHNNQTINGTVGVPEGWAVVPDDMELENFPFGDVVAEEIDGVMTVTDWVPGIIPDPEPEPEPSPTTGNTLTDAEMASAILEGVNAL